MNYNKFPTAKTLTECIEHLEKGGQLWQKLSIVLDGEEYAQIENYYELMDLVDHKENVEDWKIHLVK